MKQPSGKLASEPDLAALERRLAVLRQERKFHPESPWWVLFTKTELAAIFGAEERP